MKKYVEKSRNYYVSNDGFIYRDGNKLSGSNKDGYLRVVISFLDGTTKKYYVHRLVAEYFIDNPEKKKQVNHKNGIKTDNQLDNLEWATSKENRDHAIQNKLWDNKGENHHSSGLKSSEVFQICELLSEGRRNKDIAKLFNVSKNVITNIRNRITWTEISKEFEFKTPRIRTISDNAVRWVCNKLQEGLKVSDIFHLSENEELTVNKINCIKLRNAYTDISKDYKF